jgi:hypothetical protein
MAGQLDGAEMVGDGLILIASQSDGALHLMDADGSTPVISVGGSPADIGLDTRRSHVAVPFVALDRVDIWALPALGGGR